MIFTWRIYKKQVEGTADIHMKDDDIEAAVFKEAEEKAYKNTRYYNPVEYTLIRFKRV